MTTQADKIQDALSKATIVRLQWVSLGGMMHSIMMPKARYLELINSDDPKYILVALFLVFPIKAPHISTRPPTQVVVARPDPASLRVIEYTEGRHVGVMCDIDLTGPQESLDKWKGCPRQLARAAIRQLEDALDVDIKIGFEIEMMPIDLDTDLYNPANPYPIDPLAGRMTMSGLRGKMLDIMDEIVNALEAADIPVWRYQTEMNDQLEVSLAPATALEAIDNLYRARETIRAIFTKHGKSVTLLPKPFYDDRMPNNGCHMHLSLNPRAGSSRTAEQNANDCMSFLAGVFNQIKALFAIGMPLPESYARRLGDGAGEWIGWGTHNKRMPVRGVAPNRWEFRFLDHAANPYLFMAVLLQAGLQGVEKGMTLTLSDLEELPQDSQSKADRAAAGITERTPESIEAALEAIEGGVLGGDKELTDKLGEWLMAQHTDLRKRDAATMKELEFTQRRDAYVKVYE
jgi:glutamine synthetase